MMFYVSWMVRSLSLLLTALLCACGPQEPRTAAGQGQDTQPAKPAQNETDAQQEAIKITSWNLHWFPGHEAGKTNGPKAEAHVEAVIGVIKRLDPDILTVQEVQNAAALEAVAKETGLTLHVISDFESLLSKTGSVRGWSSVAGRV